MQFSLQEFSLGLLGLMIDLRENLRNQLIERLAARPEVRRVVLFGSRSRGDAEDRSDIDLAVEAPDASQRQCLEIFDQLEELDTLLKIDLVWWEQASLELKKRIAREGEVLYERSQV